MNKQNKTESTTQLSIEAADLDQAVAAFMPSCPLGPRVEVLYILCLLRHWYTYYSIKLCILFLFLHFPEE